MFLAKIGRAIMRRNSLYLATIVASAFALEIVLDDGVQALWEWNNRGVSGLN